MTAATRQKEKVHARVPRNFVIETIVDRDETQRLMWVKGRYAPDAALRQICVQLYDMDYVWPEGPA